MRRCAVVAGSLALVLTMQVPAQTVRNITEDWVVSTAERLDNAEVTLRGNLIVQPGGSLTLGNVKLSLGQPPSGMYRIWVQPGGSLTVSRSTLGPLQAGGSFSFVVDGGRLRLETSTVTGLAPWPDTTGFPGFPDGLTIRDAEGAVLEGNTFRQEHPQGGIGLRGSRNATIRNNTVTCATAGGKLVEQCGQVWLDDSHGNIIAGNRFRQACTAVSLRRSSNNEVTENEMTLAVSSGGIVVSDGSGYNRVANNRASNVPAGAGCTAFRIVGTELPNYILGNTFDGFRVAGYIFQAGHAVIAGNQWVRNPVQADGPALLIFKSHDLQLLNNDMDVPKGPQITHSTALRLAGNRIRAETWALLLGASNQNRIEGNSFLSILSGTPFLTSEVILLKSSGNTVERNNFFSQGLPGYDDGVNTWRSNYWAGYTGGDTDGDNAGDAPYAISGGAVDVAPRMVAHQLSSIPLPEMPRRIATVTPPGGDYITGHVTWENCTKELSGGVAVAPGASLTIKNCKVSYKKSDDALGMEFVVRAGAKLEVTGSVLGGDRPYTDVSILQLPGAALTVRDTKFQNAGWRITIKLEGDDALIENVEIDNCTSGILAGGKGHRILRNRITGCNQPIAGAQNSLIQGNTIGTTFGPAVLIEDGREVQILDNVIDGALDGMSMRVGRRLVVRGNQIRNARMGIRVNTIEDSLFWENDFVENGWPGYGSGWPDGHAIGHVAVWGDSRNLLFEVEGRGNYWSDYAGVDANGDGIGDTPYRYGGAVDPRPLMAPQGSGRCGYAVSPSERWVAGSGGTASIAVRAAPGCSWTAASDSAWITLAGPASGRGDGVVSLRAAANSGSAPRSSSITVADQTVRVVQSPAGCMFSLSHDHAAPGQPAWNYDVTVTAPPGCAWTAHAEVQWLQVTSGASGAGNGVTRYHVDQNENGQPRLGTVTVAGQKITVVQSAGPGFIPGALYNAASGIAGVAPGSFLTINALGAGPSPGMSTGRLERGLGGTRVFFDSTEAFLTYVSGYQLNLVVPTGLAPGRTTQVVIERGGYRSAPMPVYVVAANPGIFTGLAGQEQVAAVNQDQTLNSPANPAGRGSVVTFFATGVGATLPALEDGQQPQPPVFPTPVLPLSVVIGGQGVPAQDVLFAGLVYAGVLQVNVRIPESAPAGAAAPLLVRIECEKGRWCESQPGATLALR